MYKDSIWYGSTEYDVRFLYDKDPAVDNENQPLWCIEKQRVIPDYVKSGCSIGTIRSRKCAQVTSSNKYICTACEKVPSIDALRKQIIRRTKSKVVANVANSGLTKHQQLCRLKRLRVKYKARGDEIRRLKVRLIRSSGRLKKVTDLGSEHALRGDTKGLSKTLKIAYDKGLLSNKKSTLCFVQNLIENLNKKPKGKRYSSFTKSLYEVVKIWGGNRLVKLLSLNLDGPDERTVRHEVQKNTYNCKPGFQELNLPRIKKMYIDLMKEHDIKSVLVETAEDETAIIKHLTYNQKTDIIIGSCGETSPNHQCVVDYHHRVGDEDGAYEGVVKFFGKSVVSNMARVMIFNPLHIHLPTLVIYLGATCNKFDHQYVNDQWEKCKDIYKNELLEIFKAPMAGFASDGDSRRAKLMMSKSTSAEGDRYEIENQNFTLSGFIERDEKGIPCCINIMNQDYLHNGKKLTYPLDHPTRVLYIGNHLAHINHLFLVREKFDIKTHGLRIEDVERKDRQNWASAQRFMFPRVRHCLRKLEVGIDGRTEDVLGTRIYLFICYLYVEIFCSLNLSLRDRVKNASTVVNFFRIWRSWVYRSKSLNLKTNFITKQCFNHVILSCHAAVLHIKAGRDFTPQTEIQLAKTGSDCCEDFFSQNGSWIRNHHNYSFADMIDMLPKMNRLNEIRASKNGPIIPKGHKKQMNIWEEGNPKTGIAPNLRDYPTDCEISKAWTEGIANAQNVCLEVGMSPVGEPENDAERYSKQFAWFHLPHLTEKEAEILANMVDEEEEEEEDVNNVEDDESMSSSDNNTDFSIEGVIDESDIAAVNDVQRQMLDETEEGEVEADTNEFLMKVKIPGEEKFIYKSTLVSLLNSFPDGKLSKDRLVRVQAGGKTSPSANAISDMLNYRNNIGLHSDVAILQKENGTYISVLGRVQRIVKKSGKRGKIEYRNPIDLNEKSKHIDIQLLLTKYITSEEGLYIFSPGKNFIVSIQDVLIGCELSINDNDLYRLNDEDKKSIDNILNEYNNKMKHRKLYKLTRTIQKPHKPQKSTEVELGVDGRVCIEIEPTTSKCGRVQRKRRVIVGDN